MDITTLQDLRVLVKSRRNDLRLSQEALASRAGVSRRWVSMFETGHETAEVGRLLAVLQALGIHLRAVTDAGDADASASAVVADQLDAPVGLRDSLRDYDEGNF